MAGMTSEEKRGKARPAAPSRGDSPETLKLWLADRLALETDPDAILRTVAEAVGRHLGVSRVGYGEIVPGEDVITIHCDWTDGVESMAGPRPLHREAALVRAYERGETLVVPDTHAIAVAEDERRSLAATHTRAFVAVPLIHDGELVALFAANHHEPRAWTEAEVALVAHAGARTWAALQHARAIARLSESEAQFRLLADSIPGICWLSDRDGFGIWMNAAGRDFYQGETRNATDRVHPDDLPAALKLYYKGTREKRPLEMTMRVRGPDGTYRAMLTRTVPIRDAGGAIARWCGLQSDVTEQVARGRHEAFMRALSDAIRFELDADRILATVTDALRDHLGIDRVSYAEVSFEAGRPVFTVHRESLGFPGQEGGVYRFPAAFDPILAAYSRGERIWRSDMTQVDALITPGVRDYMAARGIRAGVNVPLVKDGALAALLVLHHHSTRVWSADEIALIDEIAERTWATVTRARAETLLRARERDQAFLIAWSDRVRAASDAAAILDTTLTMLGEHLGASRATYSAIRIEGGLYTIAAEWGPGEPSVLGYSYPAANLSETVRRAYLAGEMMVSDDLSRDARFSDEARRRFAENRILGRIGIPLARDGEVKAILAIDQNEPREWQPRECALAGEVADRMWGMLERARAEARLKAREQDQAFLLDWTDALRRLADPDAIMDETLARVGRHMEATRVTYSERDPGTRVFTTRWDWCDGCASLVGVRVALDDIGEALEREWLAGEIVRYDDVLADPRTAPTDQPIYAARAIRAFVSIPLIRDGQVAAIMSVQHRVAHSWREGEIALVRDAAERTWNALERARAQAKLQQRERDQAFLLAWSDRLRRAGTADQVLATTLEQLTGYLGGTRTTWSVDTGTPGEFVVIADWCRGVKSVVGARFSLGDVSQAIVDQWNAGHNVRYDDIVGDPRVLPGREAYYASIDVRAFVTVPLIVEGAMRASISVQSNAPRVWRDSEVQLIRDVSERLWIALDRAQAQAELRQRERDQAFLIGWSDLVREESGAHAILQTTVDRVGRYLGVARANYAELDATGLALQVIEEWTADGVPLLQGQRFALADLGERLMADHLVGATVAVADIATDDRLDPVNRDLFATLGIGATATVPLVRGGRIVAVLSLQQGEPRAWRTSELRLLREVADRTWSTLERARSEERLAESEALLAAFMERAPLGMHLADADGRYLRMNPELARQVGVPIEEMIGRLPGEFLPPRTARRVTALERRARREGVAREEFDIPDREAFAALQAVVFPIHSPGGAGRTGGFTIDLTERKRAEAALAKSREALFQTEKLSALGSLLAGVSHELNNPLSIVVAQAVMMERQARGTDLADRAFKIRRAADRCARIVQTFLAMARAKEPERAPVDLNAVALAALDLAEYGLRTEGVTVVRALADGLPQIAADADQLHQIVINLLINAQHALAGQAGERRVTITTAPGAEPMTVVLDVADTGPGVPEEARRRIFEPFYTTKTQGEGTGVGLSFSQGLAEAHGGRLALLPTATGATFRLTLPVDPTQTLGRAEPDAPAIAPPPARRALVVDDEVEIAESLADFLSLEGYTCEIAVGGAEAQARLVDGEWDLIVSDIRMPGTDGPALYEFVLANRPDLAARMAFATGDTLGAGVARFLAEVRRPVLEKPFVPEAVRRFLSSLEPA